MFGAARTCVFIKNTNCWKQKNTKKRKTADNSTQQLEKLNKRKAREERLKDLRIKSAEDSR